MAINSIGIVRSQKDVVTYLRCFDFLLVWHKPLFCFKYKLSFSSLIFSVNQPMSTHTI
jgi:hypothetical protein